MHNNVLAPLAVASLLVAAVASAAESRFAAVPNDQAVSTHGPYEAGACETCHERADKTNPGKALKVTNELCFDCHDDFKSTTAVKLDKKKHPAGTTACTKCHNPHNSKKRKLLMGAGRVPQRGFERSCGRATPCRTGSYPWNGVRICANQMIGVKVGNPPFDLR